MQSVFDALNKNAGSINLLFSLVVALATVFYAVLTYRLVRETKRMREVQTEPTLAIWIEPSEHGLSFINLVVENAGQGPAYNVTLRSTPDFLRFKDRRLSELGLFKYGIRHLASRQRITLFLTSMLDEVHGKREDLGRLNFMIEATCRNAAGHEYRSDFSIQFDALEGFGTIGTPPLIAIARDVERLEKTVGHVASGFNKLQVVVSTRQDIVKDNEAILARYRELSDTAPQPEVNPGAG